MFNLKVADYSTIKHFSVKYADLNSLLELKIDLSPDEKDKICQYLLDFIDKSPDADMDAEGIQNCKLYLPEFYQTLVADNIVGQLKAKVEKNNLELARLIMSTQLYPDSFHVKQKKTSTVKESLFYTALKHKNMALANSLLTSMKSITAEPNVKNFLALTIKNKDLEFAKKLVAKGADINAPDCNALLPFQHAVLLSSYEILSWLIESKAMVRLV